MIELTVTIEEKASGKLDVHSEGRDVGGATEMEVQAAEILNQLLRDGMADGALGKVLKQRLTQPIVIDIAAVPTNPHGKS